MPGALPVLDGNLFDWNDVTFPAPTASVWPTSVGSVSASSWQQVTSDSSSSASWPSSASAWSWGAAAAVVSTAASNAVSGGQSGTWDSAAAPWSVHSLNGPTRNSGHPLDPILAVGISAGNSGPSSATTSMTGPSFQTSTSLTSKTTPSASASWPGYQTVTSPGVTRMIHHMQSMSQPTAGMPTSFSSHNGPTRSSLGQPPPVRYPSQTMSSAGISEPGSATTSNPSAWCQNLVFFSRTVRSNKLVFFPWEFI